jgi:hypothetical protein
MKEMWKSNAKVCPVAQISVLDRVLELEENWTFGVYSSLYAKEGV